MRFVLKARRALAVLLALVTVFIAAVPAMASTSRVSYDGYVGETETYNIVSIDTTDLAVTEISISDRDNCSIISTLKGDCTEKKGKTVFTLTVLPNSPGTATFKYSYTYLENGKSFSNTVQVTMNITGPTPEPDLPTVSIAAGTQNTTTGVCKLTATLSGCSKYIYQWYYNTENSTSGAVPVGGQETTSSETVTLKASFDGKTEAYYYWFIKVWNADGGSAVFSKSVRLWNPYSPENVTPTPTATPNAGTDLPVITKHPGSEDNLTEGDSCYFTATAENCDEYQWTFVNASGREYTPAQAKSKLSGLKYSGDTTYKLKLSNIPATMDGWSVYCTFTNDNGSRDSNKAYITVNYEDDDDDDDDDTPVTTRRPSTPTPTPYSITPVPYVSATPVPTATPHSHSYPTNYRYDSTYHWRECDCGDTTDIGTHAFDSSGTCYVCGYQDTTASSGTTQKESKSSDPFGTIMLILGILFAVAVGVLVFILIREKKRKERLRKAAIAKKRRERAKAAAARRKGNDDDDDDDFDDDDDDGDDGDSTINLFD